VLLSVGTRNNGTPLRRRFFVSQFDEMKAVLEGKAAHHLGRVLRAQGGQQYELSDVTLLLSVVKFDDFEWAIEKATELGVSTIVPLAAARSEKGLLAATEKRSERWRSILLEASQQSRRLSVPMLEVLAKPAKAFAAYTGVVRVMLSERAEAAPLRRLLGQRQESPAVLAIGPEGGWTETEFAEAEAVGFQEASLGQSILRTETAVIAALASLNYALGPD
jgi:16S rRNA (uracil1498-N3)-methyltransferase